MRKKRILFVHQGNARAGAFISLMGLLNGIDKSRFDISICSASEDAEVVSVLKENGFDAISHALRPFAHTSAAGWYRPWRPDDMIELAQWLWDYPRACRRFRSLIEEKEPDIVHFNSLTFAPYAAVAKEAGAKVIVHVRERIAQGFLGVRKNWLQTELLVNADKVISICEDNLNSLAIPKEKGLVVYNPVDFNRFDAATRKDAARRRLGVPKNAKAVLFAGGSILQEKGLYDFLHTMAAILRDVPELVCLMPGFEIERDLAPKQTMRRRIAKTLGRFRERDRCFRLLQSSGLAERILQCGFADDIEHWIAACDVVCVPFLKPHFSRTVMEAGALIKPVVAYGIGGVQEVVRDGETGILVPVGDRTALATSVKRLLDDADLCAKLGHGGHRQARNLCDSNIYARRVQSIYDELCTNC